MKLGLYIHIPFCQQKCLYCDFPSYADMDHLFGEYVAALCREISGQGGFYADTVVDTVYIGGGTPTVLPDKELVRIINCLKSNFKLTNDIEFSIEANPGTVDNEKLTLINYHGVNRISFGVQSFSDELLRIIGRIHTAAEAAEAIEMASKAGFNNINIDLMYGLPRQTIPALQDSIKTAAVLGVQHLSIYGLKVESGTPFAVFEANGTLELPSDDVDADMYDLATYLAPNYGYQRYEISNYAKKDFASKHNLKYWRYMPYIGFGVSAHSFWNGERTANTRSINEYIKLINTGYSAKDFREKISTDTAMAEFVFLALRTVSGLHYSDFKNYFNVEFIKKYESIISDLEKRHLIDIGDEEIRLTELGMKYGNIVFAAFLE